MTILYVLAMIFGTVGGLANFPQAYKIFKRKSAKDISILTYSFLFLGAVVWILYGIELWNFPIIVTNIFGAANIGLVVIGWFLYGRGN
ncbi:MAG: SemiSWEET family transporter [Candidatus Aenigmarchaeota archaeon]|nr:SemiSWEET family transporter [Candidatus Aenigmarchaeota archaeon]